MSKAAHRFCCKLILVGLLIIGGATSAIATQGEVTPAKGKQPTRKQVSLVDQTSDTFTEKLINKLKMEGFQVSEGYPMVCSLKPKETCEDYTYPALNSCLGLNPAAPYIIAVMKSWPGEYVDPITVNAFGEVSPGHSPIYRLDPRDAVVIYGEMPPPGKYMGLQTWQWSQHGRWKAKDYNKWATTPDQPFAMNLVFETIPPNDPKPQRVLTFSAIGDIVNNVVMLEQSDEDPFGQIRYFITTPSATTDHAVRSVLQAMGVDNKHIFTEQIPSMDNQGLIGPLGMGKNAIEFNTWFRYAVPENKEEADKWRKTPPLTVLRVRPPSSVGPVKRYGSLTFEPRSANSEADLAENMQELIDAVCEFALDKLGLQSSDCTNPPPASSFMVDPVLDYGWTGPYCREISMNCDGDQNDAVYVYSKPLPLGSELIYAAVGTLATETGNATYVGMSLHDASTFYGFANLLDTDLKGSADGYAEYADDDPDFSKFFVHFFARDCGTLADTMCTTITEDMVPAVCSDEDQCDPALEGMLQIGLRDYIVPGTKRGPDSSKLLRPIIITFTP